MPTYSITFNTAVSAAVTDGVGWADVSNARAVDETPATCRVGVSTMVDKVSEYLEVTVPSIPVTSGEVIDTVRVAIKKRASREDVYDNSLRLIKGGIAVGNNMADTGSMWDTVIYTTKLYTFSPTQWGTSLTPSDINSGFGVQFQAEARTSTNVAIAIMMVDAITVEITTSIPVSAPGTPTLSAYAGDKTVSLLATTDGTDTSMEYEQSLTTGTGFVPCVGSPTTVHALSVRGLTNGTTYYFRCRAHNSGGYSSYSSERTATPHAASGYPTGQVWNGVGWVDSPPDLGGGGAAVTLTAVPGIGKVDLTWTDLTDASSYDLDWSDDQTTWVALVTDGLVTSYTHNGLENGTYYYRARGTNTSGDTAWAYANATIIQYLDPGIFVACPPIDEHDARAGRFDSYSGLWYPGRKIVYVDGKPYASENAPK